MFELPELLQALHFAAERHSDQRRKGPGGAPYVNHLIEVTALLASVAKVSDVELLMAAVLHDVLEDTATTAAELEARFGARVRELVEALSDDTALPRARRRELVLEHLRTASQELRLIKLADLTSNMQVLPSDWSLSRQREYLEWSLQAAASCASASEPLASVYYERAARVKERLAQ